MIAGKFYGIRDIRIEQAPRPQVGPGDILIRTRAAAICTSDLQAYQIGHRKLAEYTPERGGVRTPGHEFSGEIVEVGAMVEGITEGLRVAIVPNYGCGQCHFCRKGIYPLCPSRKMIGLDTDGGFAEYVLVPDKAIRQGAVCTFSDRLSYEAAALNEPLACAYNGLRRCAIQPGDIVLVMGGGPVGLMYVALARLCGAGNVIVAEPSPSRRTVAGKLGADATLDPRQSDYIAAARRQTGGRGADVVIVACGVPGAQEIAPELAATQGRINFFGRVPEDKRIIGLNSNLIYSKELSIVGSYGSRPEHFALTLGLMESGNINLLPLITNRYSIRELPKAYETAIVNTQDGKGLKTIINFNQEGESP